MKYKAQLAAKCKCNAGFRGNPTAARCCRAANSSTAIDGKLEIMNKRIGSVQN